MRETLSEIIDRHAALGAPGDQQQLIMLLQDVQACNGGALTADVLAQIAAALHTKEPILRALIRRIPSLRLSEAPHRLEICGSCVASRKLIEDVGKRFCVKNGGISTVGGFSLHVTGCMKNCRRGPSVRWDGTLYSGADAELIAAILRGDGDAT